MKAKQFIKQNEKIVHKGSFRSLLKKTFQWYNGKTYDYDILNTNSFSTAFCLTQNNEVIIIKKFSPGIEKIVFGLPGGTIENGESSIESIKREVQEETGYISNNIISLGKFPAGTYRDNYEHCFIMLNCEKKNDTIDSEILDMYTISIHEFKSILLEKFQKEAILFESVSCGALGLLYLEQNNLYG